MGDPPWVDHYHEWSGYGDAVEFCQQFSEIIPVGFSRGGSRIGHLTHQLSNIRAAVLYEAPLVGIDEVAGNFPVLSIWNWRGRKDTPEARRTIEVWGENHDLKTLYGQGRHTKIVWSSRWPFIRYGHGWDVGLNGKIWDWVQFQESILGSSKCEH